MATKQCTVCHKEKDIDMFGFHMGTKDKRQAACRICINRIMRQRRARGQHPDQPSKKGKIDPADFMARDSEIFLAKLPKG